ncbi:hypothetical protein C9E82_23250 [Paracoccus siganidrum]|uniref:Transcription regulator MerR DNA binding domain-containing protein n=1 Tax=Paracoccus siganidrum TaxID=1276757 RepID=A0A419A9T9_9RHOB|nr:hypothetical protein D3P05_04970 [Paracoccus siganidrum]RMC25198.1 hypothetical protein C9E82_23250 [Paracoccus siganidrum]
MPARQLQRLEQRGFGGCGHATRSFCIAILRFIEHAQGLGFSLKEIASVEVAEGDHPISCDEAIRLLSGKLVAVDAMIAEAKARKSRINALIAELQSRKTQA